MPLTQRKKNKIVGRGHDRADHETNIAPWVFGKRNDFK